MQSSTNTTPKQRKEMANTLKKLKSKISLPFNSKHDHSNELSSDNTSSTVPPPRRSSFSGSLLSTTFGFHSSSSKEHKMCVICQDKMETGKGKAIFTAECSHLFHFDCIVKNVNHGKRICPICRSKWKDIPFKAPKNNTERNRTGWIPLAPYVPPLEEYIANELSNYHSASSFLREEPEDFCDDESLPAMISVITSPPSRPQAVIVETFPEFPAVSASETISKFPVLVRLRAPFLPNDAGHLHRAPIDLVAVLDLSASMRKHLPFLKQAVSFVIDNLGPSDRISIVSFATCARRRIPLRCMSDSGRQDAINALRSLICGGETNIAAGLKLGLKVLQDRSEHNPFASMILLSDGGDTQNLDTCSQFLRQTIPIHTFGFGLNHDSTTMNAISDASGGTYSFIESADALQDGFARCIGGLLSVMALDVRLSIMTISPGVHIESVQAGRYKNEIFDESRQAVIDAGNLYAEEKREFLVYLSVPSADERAENTFLLDVLCFFKDSSMKSIQVEDEIVEIRRPVVLSPTDKIACLEIDRQRNRLSVAEAIAEAQRKAEMRDLEGANAILEECRSTLLSSASTQAGDGVCNWLEADLREIRKRMSSMESYQRSGRAFALSGLSSHSLQRATTRGNSMSQTLIMTREAGNSSMCGNTVSYETPSMASMVSKSQNLGSATMNPP